MTVIGTSSLHVWNIFHNESLSDYTQSNTDPTIVIFSASSNDTPPAWSSNSSFSDGNSGNTNNPTITLTDVYTQESQDIEFYFTWTTSGFSNISSIDAEWKSSSEAMWVNGSNIPLASPNTETSGNTSFQGSPEPGDYPIDVRLSAYENGSTNPVLSNVFVIDSFFRIEFSGDPGVYGNYGGPFRIFDGPANAQVTLFLDSETQDSPRTWVLKENAITVQSGSFPINSPVYYANLDANGESGEFLITTGGGQMTGSLFIIVFECINPNTQAPYALPQSPYDRLDQQL